MLDGLIRDWKVCYFMPNLAPSKRLNSDLKSIHFEPNVALTRWSDSTFINDQCEAPFWTYWAVKFKPQRVTFRSQFSTCLMVKLTLRKRAMWAQLSTSHAGCTENNTTKFIRARNINFSSFLQIHLQTVTAIINSQPCRPR